MAKFERGRLINSRKLYAGKIVDLEVDDIEVNGLHTIREIVRHPGGVVIIAEDGDGTIPFVRQHRYPPNQDLLELPAGKIDPGEDPRVTAARELEEETGLRASALNHVTSFYTSPGYCDELLHLYHAPSVETSQASPEPDEDLAVESYTLEEALELVRTGDIRDGKTVTAVFWLYWSRRETGDGRPETGDGRSETGDGRSETEYSPNDMRASSPF